ncbi:MAG: inositol monophosphatase family protein, partial [Chloroflexota bacterium]
AFVKQVRGIRRMGSAALDLAYVACGRFDGYWEQGLKPWDGLAGILLVAEAGGQISDYTGGITPQHDERGRYIASNGHIHDAIVETLTATYS